ncbi:MAG TPA: ABC transporter permease [Blastocatellia bacterium]|nr:ABC transporter permease [Blastocatellia bacterium]
MVDWKEEIRHRLAGLNIEPCRKAEIVDELAEHLEDRYSELLGGDATPEEATRAALAELSESELLARELRRVERTVTREPVVLGTRRKHMIADIWQDLRYGSRSLRKNPGFTAIAVITLALGIGANTAIFSVVNSVLLRPLPYPEPDRLAMVYGISLQAAQGKTPLCEADFLDWKSQNQVFESLAAFSTNRFNYTGGETPQQIEGAWVTSDFFSTIGVQPALGRGFLPDEDTPKAPQTVVISDGFWRRYLGSNPNVIDQQITLNARTFTIIGVMPPGFLFPEKETELWAAERLAATRRGPYYMWGLGRLNRGATLERAQSEMDMIARRVQDQINSPNRDWTWTSVSLAERIVGKVRPALLVLLVAVLFVLLIACANIANLLLARATAREKEISVRIALGASRPRLLRQLLTESLLLSAIGVAAGLPLAIWGIHLLVALSPDDLPRLQEINIDGWVLGFTLLVAAACGLIFGLAPALQSSRLNLNESLKEGGRGSADSSGRRRLRSALVVVEIAFSLMLLVGAGLMVKSFLKLQSVSPGFNPEHILTMHLTLPRAKYDSDEKITSYYRQIIDRVTAVRGVEAAGLSISLPPNNLEVSDSFSIEGKPWPQGASEPIVPIVSTSPDYFTALGVPLLQGRGFNATDQEGSPPVVIINQTLAERYFAGETAIGKRFKIGGADRTRNPWMEIVGVVGDVKYSGLEVKPEPAYYMPLAQSAWRAAYLVVRTPLNPAGLAPAIREQIWALDKDMPIAKVATMDRLLAESVAQPRFRTLLLGIFAALALVLASVGIYGVISYSVTQRTHEIGIRMALGAQAHDVSKLVIREGVALALIGVTIGLAASLALTRLMESLLFEVSTTDQSIFAGVGALLVAVAVLACWIPARRASRVDPMVALRCE